MLLNIFLFFFIIIFFFFYFFFFFLFFFGLRRGMSASLVAGMERIKLASDRSEREHYDLLADLYSIIVTVEHLERAFVRDSVDQTEYDEACRALISKYKTLFPLVSGSVPSLERFMAQYRMSCPAAHSRLQKGFSAVKEFGGLATGKEPHKAALVFQIGQHYITLMDSLKLGQVAVDQLHPHLSDLVDALNQLDHSFSGRAKLVEWLAKLNGMKASYELNPDEVRQFLFDTETTYNEFHKALSS